MSTKGDLCVFIPTRKRREMAENCVKSFLETRSGIADLVLVVDDDDDSYRGFGSPFISVPHDSLVTAINTAAMGLKNNYRALLLAADDQVFLTKDWDAVLLTALDTLGGTGILYPDDRRRYDVPEHVMMSSDIITTLGWFAEPSLKHFYVDNVWAELGKRSGLLHYCPQVVIEHRHYTVHPETKRDTTYSEAEESCGQADFATFHEWRENVMPHQVSLLRRHFNSDVQWILGKV